jgi:hypothetical protein
MDITPLYHLIDDRILEFSSKWVRALCLPLKHGKAKSRVALFSLTDYSQLTPSANTTSRTLVLLCLQYLQIH